MWVKICGNTNLNDCLLAADLGADALGFVFAKGKRTVTAGQVAAITVALPRHLDVIGVFTTMDYDGIVSTVEQAGLTGAQLHGPLDFRLLERLRLYFGDTSERCSLLQVLPWWTDVSAAAQRDAFRAEAEALAQDGSADAMLIDSRTRQSSGGTGHTFDWAAARTALVRVDYRTIIAGGLTPENVGNAIAALVPWGVDVVSGVEASPGRKSPEKLTDFLRLAKR